MTKRSPITARELMEKLHNNPEWVEMMRKKEVERAEYSARFSREEKPVLDDLREYGWNVESTWTLVNTSAPYPQLIDILLKHLQLPYSDAIREGIARSLAVPEDKVRQAWHILVNEYKKASEGYGIRLKGDTEELPLHAKDGLACTLSVAVTDQTLEEFINLIKDPSNGESRILMLSALKKRMRSKKYAFIEPLLEELANDPDLRTEITSWTWWKKKHKK